MVVGDEVEGGRAVGTGGEQDAAGLGDAGQAGRDGQDLVLAGGPLMAGQPGRPGQAGEGAGHGGAGRQAMGFAVGVDGGGHFRQAGKAAHAAGAAAQPGDEALRQIIV